MKFVKNQMETNSLDSNNRAYQPRLAQSSKALLRRFTKAGRHQCVSRLSALSRSQNCWTQPALRFAARRGVFDKFPDATRYDGFMERVETPQCQGSSNVVTWEFPARGSLPPLKVHWHDGGMKPLPRDGVPPTR